MNEKVTQLGSEREYYYRTRSFIEDTAALKVIDGKTVREIFVENQISPKTAFILAELLLIGKIKNLDKVEKRSQYFFGGEGC